MLQRDHSDPSGHKSQTRAEVKQCVFPHKASMRFPGQARFLVQQMETLMVDSHSNAKMYVCMYICVLCKSPMANQQETHEIQEQRM